MKLKNLMKLRCFTNESGYYNLTGLLPGYYAINVYEGDYLIYQEIIPFAAGDNTLDIARPISSSVSGTVYYNNDDNSSYNLDVDEKISDATVELIYYSNLQQNYLSSKNTTTDSNGYYSFTDIIPGDYYIHAVKGTEYEAGPALTVNENTTQTFNISMSLASVNVSGYAKYLTTPVENATVSFEKDGSISKNTAVTDEVDTNKNGYYTGSYNVSITVKEVNESGILYVYKTPGGLTLTVSEIDITLGKKLNIELIREFKEIG